MPRAIVRGSSDRAAAASFGGFYVIDARDLDDALVWARKFAEATNHPIEVRPFRATGRLKA